ncbi:hypothetical protein CH76_01860 [Lysinibacillus sp. BF-4]|uniref:hypothetical protein n=1 Tax=Lysinibacillus sp. BF-4 TaxID=1473546 RepID=UPI000504E5BF|nr:hypothetical protein [Lysinibacillus sp. BF-4]KFL44575.1 hypothetical protein CH76_01860 [Lysinibacillus sp. BF-4]
MHSTYVQCVGFTTSPFAIVIWKMPDMQLVCKTICYDEDEVQNALARQHQGFFKQLTPTVHYVGVAEISEKVS